MNIRNGKNRPLNTLLLVITALALALYSNISQAEDYSNNIGFMKNPPKELKEKFPMCDQFLDVKWIRQFPEGNWVGMVTADVYIDNRKEREELVVMQRQKRKGPADLKQLAISNVNISNYRGNALQNLILSADKAYSSFESPNSDMIVRGFSLRKGDNWVNISHEPAEMYTSNGRAQRSLTLYSKNVCVSLPKGEAGWLIETNRPFLDGRPMSRVEMAKLEQFKTLAAKECGRPDNEIERGSTLKDICALFKNGGAYLRAEVILQDADGEGRMDYMFGSIISFINDKHPFFMKMPRDCFHYHYYYEHQEKLKEERCVVEAKRKFLQKIGRAHV